MDKPKKSANVSRNDGGQVQIADEVIAVIAGTAMHEVDGVAFSQGRAGDLIGKKNLSKGITLNIENDQVYLTADVMVRFGMKVQDIGLAVQKRIKTAVETMTGLSVAEVNVNISGIAYDRKTQAYEP